MSGNDYQIDFSAADPNLYSRLFPEQILTLSSGRDNDPLSGAADSTSVESLAPENLALGQIVPFEFRISVDSNSIVDGDTITVKAGWDTLTTNGGSFGYDGNLGIIAAFIDAADPNASNDTNATVSDFSWTLVDSEIQGTFEITNLDPGEEIVLEAWVVLQDEIPEGTTGNVQSRLIEAETTGIVEAGDSISTGNQTIPLLRVKEFFTTQADLSIVVSDSDTAQVNIGDRTTYTIVATNNSDVVANQVLVSDILDANVQFIEAQVIDSEGAIATISHDGSANGGTLTGDLGFLNPGEQVSIEVTVEVLDTAPTGTTEDLTNTVAIASLNDDPDGSNNSYTVVHDVIAADSNSIASAKNTNTASGVFTVGSLGTVNLDYLYDGGWYKGELAVFSLEGMEAYEYGSLEYIREASARALSNSSQGRVLIGDRDEGARFEDNVTWENNFNSGDYQGIESFSMKAGDELAFMLVQHTTFADIYQNPRITSRWGKKVLFSTDAEQVVAVDNNGTLAFEDIDISTGNSDKDYNDFVFQVQGLSGNVASMDDTVNSNRDWRTTTTGQELLEYADRTIFSEGVFEVGETGKMTFDYLYDGGWYQGELAVFSLKGMELFEPGSHAFIHEAANRALSNSELGYVLVSDRSEGAKFSENVAWEGNFNHGDYQGVKTFSMNPGDQFATMLIQHATVREIADDPTKTRQWGKKALFSIPEANPGGEAQGQIVDINNTGTYAMEDLALNSGSSDRDYNDMIFQIKGASATLGTLDQFANDERDLRDTDLGEELLKYTDRGVFDEGVFVVGDSGEVKLDFLYDGGWYEGEVGIFSLDGMDIYEAGSDAFVDEAINRALSNTESGYVAISDSLNGARYHTSYRWEGDFDGGEYLGEQIFQMNPGDAFGLVLIPGSTLDDALVAPDWATKKQPFFSMSAANESDSVQLAKVYDGTEGAIFGFEDIHRGRGSNQDYNDIVLSIEGAEAVGITAIEDVIHNNRNWLETDIGQNIVNYFDI